MENNLHIPSESAAKGPLLEKKAGYYYSTTAMCSPEEAFKFCLKEENVKKVLSDLPGILDNIENYLDLTLSSQEKLGNGQYKIVWENRPQTKTSGTLTFLFKSAPANRGTLITAEANFTKLNFQEEGPSTLVNLYLIRMKALLETGEIPTIKGQPSGREELKQLH